MHANLQNNTLFNNDDLFKLKYAIFDMDGTIIDSEPLHIKAWQEVCNIIEGFPYFTMETILPYCGMPLIHIMKLIVEKYKLNYDPIYLSKLKSEIFYEKYMKDVPPIEDMLDVLKDLHEKGFKIAVATGSARYETMFQLHRLNLFKYVSAVVTSTDVTHGKPHPETFTKALNFLGSNKPWEAVVFEDTDNGMKAAYNGNFNAIRVLHGKFIEGIVRPPIFDEILTLAGKK